MTADAIQSSPRAPRQARLPISKAIELAYKGIRLRLGRSLLVVSAIALAIAFLSSILVNEAIVDAIRASIAASAARPADSVERQRAQKLEETLKSHAVPTTPAEIADARLQRRWVVGLALLVAFVGIVNAMLMSVTERFREIGTMKCLGALDEFIVKLFVIESAIQGVAGTVVGVAAGMTLTLVSAAFSYGVAALQHAPAGRLLLDAVFCFAVGVGLTMAGAVYPAWEAARMQPVEAMRVET
jgi:putative ABC transport system permease protein